jgi:hypothetical protein
MQSIQNPSIGGFIVNETSSNVSFVAAKICAGSPSAWINSPALDSEWVKSEKMSA